MRPGERATRRGGWWGALALLVVLSCDDGKTIETTVCKGQKYPAAPAGAKLIVHVSKCGAGRAGADGSAEHPYDAIQTGVDRAGEGGAVLVAPGLYDESVTVARPMTVSGGTDPDASGDAQSVVVQPPGGIGVHVHGGPQGSDTRLSGLIIAGAQVAGVRVEGGAVALDAVTVRGTQGDAAGQFGYGIYVEGGQATLSGCAVEGSSGVGLVVGGGQCEATGGRIEGNRGGGAWLLEGEALALRQVEVRGNTAVGVAASRGKLTLEGGVVAGTLPDGEGIADGVLLSAAPDDAAGGPVEASLGDGCVVEDNGRVGVLFGRMARGSMRQCQVRRSGGGAPFGAGVWLQAEAGGDEGIVIEENAITENRFVGLAITGKARALVRNNTAIGATVAGEVFVGVGKAPIGDGLSLFDGARGSVTGNVIEGNARLGLIADGCDGAEVSVSGNTIRGNQQLGAVDQNSPGAPVDLVANSYSANAGGDSKVIGAGESRFAVKKDSFATR